MPTTETTPINIDNFEKNLKCSISLSFFLHPVVLSSGHTVEEDMAKRLLSGNNPRCPQTRELLKDAYLPNKLIKSQVEDYLTNNPEKRKEQYGYEEQELKSDDPDVSEEQELKSGDPGVSHENNVSVARILARSGVMPQVMPQVVPNAIGNDDYLCDHKLDFPAAVVVKSRPQREGRESCKVLLLGNGKYRNDRFALLLAGEYDSRTSYMPSFPGSFTMLDETDHFVICNTACCGEDYKDIQALSFPQTDILLLFGNNPSKVKEWADFYTRFLVNVEHFDDYNVEDFDYYELTYRDNNRHVNVNKVGSSEEITTSSPQFDVDDQGTALATARELIKTLKNEALEEERTSSCTIM